jgi:hypothetical protein
MFEEQKGLCYICGEKETRRGRHGRLMLGVDHDHITGRIRRLLCHNCNVALGLLADNPLLFEKAAAYLRQFED